MQDYNFEELSNMLKEQTLALDKKNKEGTDNHTWISEDADNQIVIAFPRGNRDDVVVTYLEPLKTEEFKKIKSYDQYKHEDELYLTVRQEKIGDKLSKRRCALYLHSQFPNKSFSETEIQRCYNIFLLVVRNCTYYDFMTDYRTDFGYEDYHLNHGVFTRERSSLVESFFQTKRCLFLCYNMNRQDEKDYKDFAEVNQSLPDKLLNPTFMKYPVFSLRELLESDIAYEIFYKYWNGLPNYEKTMAVLKEYGLTRDTINLIFTKIRDEKYKNKEKPYRIL